MNSIKFAQKDYSSYLQQKTKIENRAFENARAHAIKRARERYNLELSIKDYRQICGYIKQAKNNICQFADKFSDIDGGELYKVYYQNKTLFAVWNLNLDTVSTFLTPKLVYAGHCLK